MSYLPTTPARPSFWARLPIGFYILGCLAVDAGVGYSIYRLCS